MGIKVTLIEGKGGADDTIKVDKDGTETVFDTIDDAARFIGEETEWLESKLDDEGYDSELDIDDAHENDPEDEEESGKGAA
jgi:hypothetical protein